MSKYQLIILCIASLPLWAQEEIKGRSSPQSFNITKDPPKPPLLMMVPGSLKFSDTDGNNNIDGNESCRIEFDVENKGYGKGTGLYLLTSLKQPVKSMTFEKRASLETIPVNGKLHVTIPITAGMDLPDGKASFVVSIEEPNGFNMDPTELEVNTVAFKNPWVKVTDYSITGENSITLLRKRPFDLQVLIQNTQYGKAEDVTINLVFPQDVILLSSNHLVELGDLAPGETKSLIYNIIVSDKYTGENIPFKVNIAEKYSRFAENRTITASINQSLAGNKLVVEGAGRTEQPKIQEATLTSDVDRDIPNLGKIQPNRYALVIGNEDYARYQTGLKAESNVVFANADARSFAEYAKKTLGVEDRKVTLLLDAPRHRMEQEINRLTELVKTLQGDAELLVFYSGHGIPDASGDAYILPVDVNAAAAKDAGIRLGNLYDRLTEHNPKRVTVFMDACFSGAGRNEGLLAAKAARIAPNRDQVSGNLVIFTSSTGDEKSQFDDGLKHGVFTYFLLKKFAQSRAEVTYEGLAQYLALEVPRYLLEHYKEPQHPQVLYGPEIEGQWRNWTFTK